MAPDFRVESIWLMLPIKGQIDEQLDYRNMMYLTYRRRSEMKRPRSMTRRHRERSNGGICHVASAGNAVWFAGRGEVASTTIPTKCSSSKS